VKYLRRKMYSLKKIKCLWKSNKTNGLKGNLFIEDFKKNTVEQFPSTLLHPT